MINNTFRTPIQLAKSTFSLDHPDAILALGSCFSQHIGDKLFAAKFPVLINPFGVLFDPISILSILNPIDDQKEEDHLTFYQGIWHALKYHGSFNHQDKEVLLKKIYQTKNFLQEELKRTKVLIVTLGTAHVWRKKDNHSIVGNCHKLPGENFQRDLLSPDEISDKLIQTFSTLKNKFPAIRIIVTVSPVRHLKQGMLENQLSKSVLRYAIHSLKEQIPEIYYFPSYEIMMDDLRDYRFYHADMIHPNDQAVDYIFECFKSVFFSKDTIERIKIWENFRKIMKHKVREEDSKHWAEIKDKFKKRLEVFKNDFPTLNWNEEETFCNLS